MSDVCPECGVKLRRGARFCHECGASITVPRQPETKLRGRGKGLLSCEQCGNPLPKGARFCGVCGRPVKISSKKEIKLEPTIAQEVMTAPKVETRPLITKTREEPSLHEIPILSEESFQSSAETIENELATQEFEIPDEMITILYARKRVPVLQKELNTQREELDALSEKMNVGLLTKKEAMDQLKVLKKKISELQAEKEQLDEAASVLLEIESLDEERKKLVEWVTKLKELKKTGKTSEAVFQKVKREYEDKRNNIESQLTEQILRLKQWANLLKKKIQRLSQELETLRIKLQVGEISTEDVTEQIKETEKELEKTKLAEEQAREILQQFL
ncbi:MAG: zinc ribbon domain-containing protein [Candidatus Heimdallarchaeota archaeon]